MHPPHSACIPQRSPCFDILRVIFCNQKNIGSSKGVNRNNTTHGLSIASLQQRRYLTRMNPCHQSHGDQHERRVEHVQENLVRDQIPIITLRILDQTKQRSQKNERAGTVKRVQVDLPPCRPFQNPSRWAFAHANVEDGTRYYEATEEKELHHKSADDDLFSRVYGADFSGGHDAAAWYASSAKHRCCNS